jgi:septum site-determining protein MinD
LIGIVPRDEEVTVSTNKGEPVVLNEKALSGQAFNNIARRILGEEVPFINLDINETGFMASLKKLFRIK